MAKWYDMFELFTEPVLIADKDNMIIYANPAAEKLYRMSFKKRRAEDFIPPLLLKSRNRVAVGVVYCGGTAYQATATGYEDCRVFTVQSPIGPPKMSSAPKTTYTDRLANDFRDSLQTLNLSINMLKGKLKDPDQPVRDCIARLERSYYKMHKKVSDVLDLQGANMNRSAINVDGFDLVELMEEVVDSVSNLVKQNGSRVVLVTKVKKFNFFGDRTQIRRVFLRIIANALQRSNVKNTVRLGLEVCDNTAEIRFSDDCGAIGAEDLTGVFNAAAPFSGDVDDNSLSVDMSLVFKILQTHNGEIVLEKTGNRGLAVVITIKSIAPEGQFRSPTVDTAFDTRGQLLTEFANVLELDAFYSV